jgi:hypothetical protein
VRTLSPIAEPSMDVPENLRPAHAMRLNPPTPIQFLHNLPPAWWQSPRTLAAVSSHIPAISPQSPHIRTVIS